MSVVIEASISAPFRALGRDIGITVSVGHRRIHPLPSRENRRDIGTAVSVVVDESTRYRLGKIVGTSALPCPWVIEASTRYRLGKTVGTSASPCPWVIEASSRYRLGKIVGTSALPCPWWSRNTPRTV